MPTIPSESVDLVLADPPYLVDYRGRHGSGLKPIVGDNDADWVRPVSRQIWRVLKQNKFFVTFYGWENSDVLVSQWKQCGFRIVGHFVCVKNSIGLGYYMRGRHETAFLLAKGKPARPERPVSDVFFWEREPLTFHQNQKPLHVISQMIAAFSKEGDLILDPFMGSGTTLVAARNLGRRAIGIEIEERYYQIAAQRLAQEIFEFQPAPDDSPTQLELRSHFEEGGL